MRQARQVALSAALLLAAGCAQPKPAAPPPTLVDTADVRRGYIATYVTFNGQVSPVYQSTLSTAEAGTVASVNFTEGQFVTKGQLLASLDTSQLRAQLAANQAIVRENSATLYKSDVQAPVNSQQYSSAVAAAQQALQSANNQVRAARSALANATLTYQADQKLIANGYVAESDLTAARSAYVTAQETLRTDRQTVASAQAALKTAEVNTEQRLGDQATIQVNREALDAARANVDLLQAQIRQASIYAPFDGQITQRLLDPGAYAGANSAILQLTQTSTVFVVANVPDTDLAAVSRGKAVTFTTSSLAGRTFHGRVFDINTTPTAGTLSYRVRVLEANPDYALRGGMLVLVTAQRAEQKNALVVPLAAIFPGDSGNVIYTIEGGKAKAPAGGGERR
jgi:multidrug efflux pump subunit AcrA (membrane-fusion protein)